MQEMALNNRQADEHVEAYASDWDHLTDELRRLDLFIRLRLLREQHDKPPNVLDQFRGLVLSDIEITRLLADRGGPPTDDVPQSHGQLEEKKLVRALADLDSRIERRRTASAGNAVYLSLPTLARVFRLTPFEEQCLTVCLAPELDRKYEKLYAYLQDDVTRKKPSVDLALSLFCKTAAEKLAKRSVFDRRAPLLKYRLLQMSENSLDTPSPLLQQFLKLDDRITAFLLGSRQMDARLAPVARLIAPSTKACQTTASDELRERMRGFLQIHFSEPGSHARTVIFYLHGPNGSGKRSLATAVSHDLGLSLIVADAGQLLSGPLGFEEAIWLLCRDTVLHPAALCLENVDALLADPDKQRAALKVLVEAMLTFAHVVFLLGSHVRYPQELLGKATYIALEMPSLDAMARSQLWQSLLNGQHRLAEDVNWGVLASKFALQPGQMRAALAEAENLALWRVPAAPQITMADLHTACRAQSEPKLNTLACKIEPRYGPGDIVLPEDQAAQLREICQQAEHRHIVYGEWGFGRQLSLGKGLNALFSGPPGTGKTMAAEVIAHELRLDLYRIDLSQVVSKYIGETEKNLHRIFLEAQTSCAILFFDEADALFGKRSEVKDSHDRYANIEVGYLLQKIEEYEGIAILATNLRQHLDEAFVRRMQFIIEFPFPDEDYRRRIWQVIFPREAPLGKDIDFGLLAREVKLSGGNIKNIALAAAFYAAAEAVVIGMPHLIRAARREFQKLGRTWNETVWSRQGETIS